MERLLQVKNLKIKFLTEEGALTAVNGVSFSLHRGEVLGLVGESGCGKSAAALSLLKLIPCPPGSVQTETAIFDGRELFALSEKEMRKIRGNDIAMIFQEPMSSLNPAYTVGNQIGEAIRLHQGLNKRESKDRSIEMLKLVGFPRAEKMVDEYPHSLSGGMRQRAMIAMALSCRPKLLIADEPTTALDVTIQAQILELMKELIAQIDTAILYISHDLGVMAEMAERVMVMYAGKIVEEAGVANLFKNPLHPYTAALINSKPKMEAEPGKLPSIPGQAPNPLRLPAGCAYHPRCDRAIDLCRVEAPIEAEVKPGHMVSCWCCR